MLKLRKNVLLTLSLAFAIFTVTAQPSYRLYKFNIEKGEGENYYEREAKRNLEPGSSGAEKATVPERFHPGMAMLNAATGLKIAKRKGSISDLQAILRENYDWVTESNLTEAEDLAAANEEFEDDETVANRAEVINYYTLVNKYNRVLKTMPPNKFEGAKKKDPDLELDVQVVKDQLAAARESFEKAKESAAAMHYEKGRELARNEDLESSKEAAKRFRYATEYVADFRDASVRYEDARKLGTTRLGVSQFESFASSEYGDLGSKVTNDVLSRFTRDRDEFEFFEVIDRDALDQILAEQKLSLSGLMDESTTAELGGLAGVNAILVGKVTQANVDRQQLDRVIEEFEKKVKVGEEKYMDDGKEKTRDIKETVKVRMYKNQKISNASVSASYKILDVSTGAVLGADNPTFTSEWRHIWYTYAGGDKRAIPRRLTRSEQPFISQSELALQALRRVTDSVNDQVGRYAKDVSK